MLSRSAAFGGVVAIAAAIAGSMPATAGPPPIIARSIYIVRPDPRLCPSPLCGGYWVSRANHSRTRCHDGMLRPRCYVAIAIDVLTRQPSTTGLPENALARAVIGSWMFDGFGELGAVTLAEVWKPVGRARPTGDFFRLRDTGVRCVRAPCFSLRAWRINSPSRTTISGLDLRAPRPTPGELARAEAALATSGGLFVAGRVVRTADGGRLFRASQFFLSVPTPRD